MLSLISLNIWEKSWKISFPDVLELAKFSSMRSFIQATFWLSGKKLKLNKHCYLKQIIEPDARSICWTFDGSICSPMECSGANVVSIMEGLGSVLCNNRQCHLKLWWFTNAPEAQHSTGQGMEQPSCIWLDEWFTKLFKTHVSKEQ